MIFIVFIIGLSLAIMGVIAYKVLSHFLHEESSDSFSFAPEPSTSSRQSTFTFEPVQITGTRTGTPPEITWEEWDGFEKWIKETWKEEESGDIDFTDYNREHDLGCL